MYARETECVVGRQNVCSGDRVRIWEKECVVGRQVCVRETECVFERQNVYSEKRLCGRGMFGRQNV